MVQLAYRTATIGDASLAADLMTAALPRMPQDPVMTRYRWESASQQTTVHGRFIGELDGRPVAFVSWVHGPWEELPERHCEVDVWLDRAWLERERLRSSLTWICEQAVAEGAWLLLNYTGEDQPDMLEVLAECGFERDRVERFWELDLRLHGERIVRQAREAKTSAASVGVELVTLADWQDPDKLKKLHEMDARTRQDIPSSLPILRESLASFERRIHAPDRPLDRSWVALADGRPVALSYLKFPPVRGLVWTGYTASHPDYRGRGLARAVKLQSLAQAVELGVPAVGTDNDAENSPMLHINRELGYTPTPGLVGHLKRVRRRDDG